MNKLVIMDEDSIAKYKAHNYGSKWDRALKIALKSFSNK